jgi:glycerol uptake facilitator-like aquaporin
VVNAQSDGAISRAAGVTAPGLMVMAIILFMVAVPGAHLNPAVSIAFAARGDFPWRRVCGYIILAGLWSSPVSGASMKPARSFGPDMALRDFHNNWP